MFIELFIGLAVGSFLFGRDAPQPRSSMAEEHEEPRKTILIEDHAVSTIPIKAAGWADANPGNKTIKLQADGYQLTQEIKAALTLMEKTNRNIFITGGAGSGKSTLLAQFRAHTRKNSVVLAPTGIAALNVNGATIHSFFRFPFHPIEENDPAIKIDKKRSELFKKLDQIIIDEISMVRSDILQAIDKYLRINKGVDLPFGGIQIIAVGDPFQLPPVVEKNLGDYFEERFTGPYFFNAPAFGAGNFELINLTRCFRQEDRQFLACLNNIRDGSFSYGDLDFINRTASTSYATTHTPMITLCSTNRAVNEINDTRMLELSSQEFIYHASISGKIENDLPAERELRLKQGAQIMMLRNSPGLSWRNGSLGYVSKLAEDSIEVCIDGSHYTVYPETWEIVDYAYDRATKKLVSTVVGEFTQYPLKLAWAITIHKSQGQTFDRVKVDLGWRAFAHGQTYVALSRCRTLSGLSLSRQIKQSDVIVDPKIKEFAASWKSLPPSIS